MKKFYFLFLFALIASVSNLWAAEKKVTFDFDGTTFPGDGLTATDFETFSIKDGEKCASTGGNATATLVTTASYSSISSISFNMSKTTDNSKSACYIIYVSEDGKTWVNKGKSTNYTSTTIEKNVWTAFSLDLTNEKPSGYVKIEYSGTTAVRLIDKIEITYEEQDANQCATPTFNVTKGTTYDDAKKLEITTTTEGATLDYTIKRGDVEVGSATGAQSPATIELSENGVYTVTATAKKDGLNDSAEATTEFTIAKKCAAPEFSLESDTYFEDKLLEFSSTTTGSTIHYTVNDGAEATGDFINFTINGTYVVSAWTTKDGYENSEKSTVTITIIKDLVFYESFDKCSGTGGNDDQWSGSIATNTVNTDNEGWSFSAKGGAYKCVRVGVSKTKGTATTPALTKLDGDATITFRAGAWTGDKNTLTVTASNGTLTGDTNVTLADSQFKDYTVTITGGDATTKITFAVNEKRFFLDEVLVVAAQASNVATPTFTPASGDVNLDSKITMATATEGATISYSTDEGANWTDGAEYTAATKGALTLWARATKDGEESAVAKTTFNVIDPNEIGEIVVNVTADKTTASDKYFGTMTVNVPVPANATEMDVVITKDGAAYSSDKNLTVAFSKEIKETGKYVITVTAENDENIESNEEAPKTVDFCSSSLGSIAEFLLYAPENETTFGRNLDYEFTCPLTVTYANGNNLWVTDGTDGLLIYDSKATFSYANGTVFSAGLKGTYTVYNQTIELTDATLTATTTGTEASPKTIEIAGITKDNQSQYVIIADAVFDASKTTLADAAGNTVTCYTGKNYCTVPEDGTYDVVGIVNYFGRSEASAAVQVYPLAFLSKPVVTAGFTKAEITAKPWLAEKDVVLTTEEEDLKASCVKLTCQDGAQIVYSLQGTGSEVEGTADSGVELTLEKDIYELTVQTLADGFKGVAVTYTFIVDDTSSVSKVSAEDGVKVVAAEGGVEVVAAEAADVAVYTVAGQLVRAQRVAEGSTLVNVPAGFYVVRAAGTVAKVVVK